MWFPHSERTKDFVPVCDQSCVTAHRQELLLDSVHWIESTGTDSEKHRGPCLEHDVGVRSLRGSLVVCFPIQNRERTDALEPDRRAQAAAALAMQQAWQASQIGGHEQLGFIRRIVERFVKPIQDVAAMDHRFPQTLQEKPADGL